MAAIDVGGIAAEVLACLDGRRQRQPYSATGAEISCADAYAVTAELRRLRIARGERPLGRKIGFTNRNIWAEYKVFQPIWGDVYDTTMRDVSPGAEVRASHLPEPRIEPEIVLGLARDIPSGASLAEVAAAIGWVAHGFEIVQSIYPDWRFAVNDCVVDGGLHGALYVGPRRAVAPGGHGDLPRLLSELRIELSRNGEAIDRGVGTNVLDGPVHALKHLVDVLSTDRLNPPLKAGELVTTGTITRAFPVVAGERWSTVVEGFDLPGMSVTIV